MRGQGPPCSRLFTTWNRERLASAAVIVEIVAAAEVRITLLTEGVCSPAEIFLEGDVGGEGCHDGSSHSGRPWISLRAQYLVECRGPEVCQSLPSTHESE